MGLDVLALLGAGIAALLFLLRAAWKNNARVREKEKRLRETLDAITKRDKKMLDIRKDSDEDLVDRLSPPR